MKGGKKEMGGRVGWKGNWSSVKKINKVGSELNRLKLASVAQFSAEFVTLGCALKRAWVRDKERV